MCLIVVSGFHGLLELCVECEERQGFRSRFKFPNGNLKTVSGVAGLHTRKLLRRLTETFAKTRSNPAMFG